MVNTIMQYVLCYSSAYILGFASALLFVYLERKRKYE